MELSLSARESAFVPAFSPWISINIPPVCAHLNLVSTIPNSAKETFDLASPITSV